MSFPCKTSARLMKRFVIAVSYIFLTASILAPFAAHSAENELSAKMPTSASIEDGRWGTSVYSQNTAENRTGDFVSQTQIRQNILRRGSLGAHLGLWLEQDSLSTKELIYNDNQVSPLVGASWKSAGLPIGALAEALYVQPFNARGKTDAQSELITRLSLYHSDLFELRAQNLFLETYSAATYTTRLEDNLIGEHWTKAGARLRHSSGLYADAFGEVRARKNSRSFEWDDFGDLRAGGRLGFYHPTVSASVAVTSRLASLWGTYSPSLLGLLVIGAEL